MRQLYAGIDLHSNNSHIGILDETDTRIYHKRLPNQRDVILAELEPFKQDMVSISIESTFNWYWLVDCLQETGYNVHLANPAAMQQISADFDIQGLNSVMINMMPFGWHIWIDSEYSRKDTSTQKMLGLYVTYSGNEDI